MARKTCSSCGGTGYFPKSEKVWDGQMWTYQHTKEACGYCHGSGTVYEPDPPPPPPIYQKPPKPPKPPVAGTEIDPHIDEEETDQKERKQTSWLLALVGAFIGYIYASPDGDSTEGWVILGGLIGFFSYGIVYFIAKMIWGAFMVFFTLFILYLIYHFITGS